MPCSMVMVRFLASLLASALLLTVAQLSIAAAAAAPSEAEDFWATALPDYPIPDALLWYLRPCQSCSSTPTLKAQSRAQVQEMTQALVTLLMTSPNDSLGNGLSITGPTESRNLHHTSLLLPRMTWLNDCPGNGHSITGHTDSRDPHRCINLPLARSSSDDQSHSHVLGGAGRSKMNMSAVFFHEDAVQVGRSLPFYFPPARRAPLGMLPRNVADSIPFSSQALLDILAWLGVAVGSAEAADIEKTLSMCEAPSPAREPKFCATSLEVQLEGASSVLGAHDIRPLTSLLPRYGAPWQPYVIRAVRPEVGSRFVSCHDVVYLYTVYRCHDTGPARLYMVEMEGGRGGGIVDVAVVCHTDTSQWNPEHLAFKLLGTKPGGPPVCHVMPYGHIVWANNGGGSSS